MKPNDFYGMSLRDLERAERRERLHRSVLIAAFVLVFVAGIVLGWSWAKW
jgi:hypothetical protein